MAINKSEGVADQQVAMVEELVAKELMPGVKDKGTAGSIVARLFHHGRSLPLAGLQAIGYTLERDLAKLQYCCGACSCGFVPRRLSCRPWRVGR